MPSSGCTKHRAPLGAPILCLQFGDRNCLERPMYSGSPGTTVLCWYVARVVPSLSVSLKLILSLGTTAATACGIVGGSVGGATGGVAATIVGD